ncbi:MAG: alpha/beta hydrolase [Spirochaetia bacterium]|nr:alpha/beta hydrolase [Spirochaetia bacterium]
MAGLLILAACLGLSACGYLEVEVIRDVSYGPNLKLDVYRKHLLFNQPQSGPAMVMVHGGGWKGGDKNDFFYEANNFAMDRGCVCFSLNYRLVDNGNNLHPAGFDDVQRAIRWVRANGAAYGADVKRIAVMGGSAGGHLALLAAIATNTRSPGNDELSGVSSLVSCCVNFYGPSDLAAPWNGTTPNFRADGKDLVEGYLGTTFARNPALFSNASPLFLAAASTRPVMFIHSKGDPLVPLDQSTRLHEKLKSLGVPSVYLPVDGTNHGIDNAQWKTVYEESYKFLSNYL